MRLFRILFWALPVLSSVLVFNDCSEDESHKINASIQEAMKAITVAIDAITQESVNTVNDGSNVFRAAYNPLFKPDEKVTISKYLANVLRMGIRGDFLTMIYCQEKHIRRETGANPLWVDTAYFDTDKGTELHIPVQPIDPRNMDNKPGKRGSYSTIGWKYQKNNQEFDCSNQAHVFIKPGRLRDIPDQDVDNRKWGDIVDNGLDQTHHSIDTIKGLTHTVLHELLHVSNGVNIEETENGPVKRGFVVNDGRSPKVYKWVRCAERRQNGESNVDKADCITALVQALYLQIKGKPTYWWTSVVDPGTLAPHLPGNLEQGN